MTIDTVASNLQNEAPLDLTGYAPKSAWEGWFPGVIQREYTVSGYTFKTEDAPVRDPAKTSRNISLAVTVKNKAGDERNVNGRINYEPTDLSATRKSALDAAMATAKEAYAAAKSEFAKANGGNAKGFPRKFNEFVPKDITRTSMTFQRLGGIQAAIKSFNPAVNGSGGIDISTLFGEAVDVHLKLGDTGYPEIDQIAPTKTHKETR